MEAKLARRLGIAMLSAATAAAAPGLAAQERAAAPDFLGAIRSAWSATTASDFRYFSWQSNRGFPHRSAPSDQKGRGSQIYVPFALQLVGRPHDDLKIEILGRGGWVWSRQRTRGLSGEVSTQTDTVASTTFTYYGISGIQPFVSTSFNFPTGRANLSGAAANARMDPDYVEVTGFGEGFNFGPTGGFNLPITPNLMLTLSAGYTFRNSFTREASIAATEPVVQARTNVNPGDTFTATGALGFQIDQLSGSVSAAYSLERTTTENGAPLYRAGNRYVISAKFSYNWAELGQTNVNGSYSHSDRNKVLVAGASSLVTEPFNTNSNVFRVGVEHLFPLEPVWVGPIGSYLYRDRNAYDANTFQFVPAKERWTAGLVARMAAGENVTFNARFEHVWANERENPADGGQKFSVLANTQVLAVRLPPIVGTGWQAAIGFNFRF